MSSQPIFDISGLPPEMQEKLGTTTDKTKKFYRENRNLVLFTAAGVTLVLLNRRQITKIVGKAIMKSGSGPAVVLPSNHEIFEALHNNPSMIYVEHGSGIMHFLADDRLMVSVQHNMSGWNSEQIKKLATRAIDHVQKGVQKVPFELKDSAPAVLSA